MLSREYVSKVRVAIDALYFGSHSVRVRRSFYSTWNFVVETWPATVRFKLVLGTIKFCTAAFTDVDAFFPESVVFACEGHFRAFFNYYLFFFRGKLLEVVFFSEVDNKTPN
jgi:hypothetical protein